jgi:class 3 adenylate cyclase
MCGSTAFANADAMRAALLKHDDVLRIAIEKHEGFLFSHTGDGMVAAFKLPALNAKRLTRRSAWTWTVTT